MPTRLILIRHLEKDSTIPGAMYGSKTDMGIAANATEGFAVLQKLTSQFDAQVYCSPMLRCQQTADYFFPYQEKILLEEAKEIDFGAWEGLTISEIQKQYQVEFSNWANDDFIFPKGESMADFQLRVILMLQKILKDPVENKIIVTHGGVIRVLLCKILNLPISKSSAFEIQCGAATSIKIFDNGLGVLEQLNFTGDPTWLK